MKFAKLGWIVAASALVASTGAYAADADNDSNGGGLTMGSGWYVAGSLGLDFLEDQHNHSGNTSFDFSSDPGFAVTGALGKDLGNGFRAEGELGYRQFALDHATVYSAGGTGIASGSAGGDANAFSVMGNGYYDFSVEGPIKPYIGAGLGFARVAYSGATVNGVSAVDDSDVAFAYQAMAGLSYQLTSHATVYTGYRYFATLDPRFNDSAGQRVDSEFESNDVEVGYRFTF